MPDHSKLMTVVNYRPLGGKFTHKYWIAPHLRTDNANLDQALYYAWERADQRKHDQTELSDMEKAIIATECYALECWDFIPTADKAAIIDEYNEGCQKFVQAPLPPDPEGMNDERADNAGAAINVYMLASGSDKSTVVRDLVASIHHWCDRNNVDFDSELLFAEDHYNAETEGE